MIRVLPYKLAE